MNNAEGALIQLRAYISQSDLGPNDRLPPERDLCDTLGVSRTELRKAFSVLEAEGTIWRHVGRGTFMTGGAREEVALAFADIAKHTTPYEVMHSRLLIEPLLAREAALHATARHMEAMREMVQKSRHAKSWREYEVLDNQFHRLCAEACQNPPLLAIYDLLNTLRRSVVWGRMRPRPERPPENHHSFAEHQALLEAIENRDGEQAFNLMRMHLQSVTDRLLPK